MLIARTITGVRDYLAEWRRKNKTISLTPTMGGLHEGHYSLVKKARELSDRTVATIFVNPAQFNKQNDFNSYPRNEEKDCAGLKACGVDLVFIPSEKTIYPRGNERKINSGALGKILCGAFRPGHFDGVVVVVSMLFELLRPNLAIFGEKDYQQLLIIRKMVKRQRYPVEIVSSPTTREADGLAMSSRNELIDPKLRQLAGELYRTLKSAKITMEKNRQDYEEISANAKKHLRKIGFSPEYFEFRDKNKLEKPSERDKPEIILAAARLGNVRLIDNVIIENDGGKNCQ